MIDYDLNPPIRFQFEGDTDAARRRIPQARALMNQLIRRMEGGGVEALNWRVNTADGTFFEIHKYGAQHVALIRCPVPVVNEEATLEPVIAEFEQEGNGDYLWIGARLLYNSSYPASSNGTEYYDGINDSPYISEESYSSSRRWYKNRPTYAPGDIDTERNYAYADHKGLPPEAQVSYPEPGIRPPTPVDTQPNATLYAVPNIMVFEPGWTGKEPSARVFQSANGYAFGLGDVKDTSLLAIHELEIPRSELAGGIYYPDSIYPYNIWLYVSRPFTVDDSGTWYPPGWYTHQFIFGTPASGLWAWRMTYNGNEFPTWAVGDVPIIERPAGIYFEQKIIVSESGFFTTSPMCYNKLHDGGYQVQASVCLDGKEVTISAGDCHPKPDVDGKISDLFADVYDCTVIEATHIDSVSVAVEQAYPSPEVVVSSSSGTQYTAFYKMQDVPVSAESTYSLKGTVFSGLYEVRLSGYTYDNDGIGPDQCEVYIQVDRDKPPRTYTVAIPQSGPEAFFDMPGWLENGAPTAINDAWYPGCWLIDIKNKTIIHETRPNRLDRPWFA